MGRFPDAGRRVQFTKLEFDTLPPTIDHAYKQYHVVVAVDSKQVDAYVEAIKPTRTRGSDGVEKQAFSTKFTKFRGASVGVTPGPHTVGGITFTANNTIEKGKVIEKTRYDSTIVDHRMNGIVWWSFNVDDDNFRTWGINMAQDLLPSVSFEFVGDETPPKSMDIMIASQWSVIQRKDDPSWISKLFLRFRSSGSTETPSYSNLFQVVAMKTVPSNLPKRFHYHAEMEVSSGAGGDPKVTRLPPESLNVIPRVVDGR